MEKKSKPEIPDHSRWLTSFSAPPAENFVRDELILCGVCNRTNAPTRSACLYCGAQLATATADSGVMRPVLRELEQWEAGWNVILQPIANRFSDQLFDQSTIVKIADYLQREANEIKSIFDSTCTLPLARVESSHAADQIKKFLRENNVETKVIADENLKVKTPPKRVRAFEITTNALKLRLIGWEDQSVFVETAAVSLLVVGALYERQIENSNERNRQKNFEIKDSRETSRDENILDFYVAGDPIGFRISTRNCDFSGLGAAKKMLVGENFKILLDKLRADCARAEFDNCYDQARARLNSIWRLEENRESLGWQRTGLGKIKTDNRLTISNADQLLRYSRMLRELQNKEFN